MDQKSDDIDESLENILEISYLSDSKVTEFLKERFLKGRYYTWAGFSLIAVNPCQNINELYTPGLKTHYLEIWKNNNFDQIKPHIYAVASRAKYQMVQEIGKVSQTIVLTGESGSGKTHSASHLLDLLLDSNTKFSGLHSTTNSCQWANLILKAFGNAQTICNSDSSRFGKFLLLYWTCSNYSTSHILGAHMETYLLEKTRVTNCNMPDGRNFHIFHQILSGLSDLDAAALQFPITREFRIAPDTYSHTDKNAFYETIEAAEKIGISKQDWWSILTILAAILHLGNVDFQNDREDVCSLKNNQASVEGMQSGCQLLGVEEKLLTQLFTSKLIVANIRGGMRRNRDDTRGCGDVHDQVADDATETCRRQIRRRLCRQPSIFRKPCSIPYECSARRDSILRYLYHNLFQWILNQINGTLSLGRNVDHLSSKHVIGILDIFGFEVFENNSLEQLCINYTNEKLQHYYVKNSLIDYQNMIEEEGFSLVEKGCFSDNSARVALFDSSPSIFGILNDESVMMRRNQDENFLRRLEVNIQSPYLLTSTGDQRSEFVVCHYAGNICYNTFGMVVKNADKVPDELVEFLALSRNAFMKNLLHQEDHRSNSKKPTLLAKFMVSLNSLTRMLDNMDIHYVRCLKAHPLLKPGIIDSSYFYQQLQYAGIIDSVNLKQKIYPIRMKYEEFLERYQALTKINLIKNSYFKAVSNSNQASLLENKKIYNRGKHEYDTYLRSQCEEILTQMLEKKEINVQWGKSSIFLRESILISLELKKKLLHEKAASIIQSSWYKYNSLSKKSLNMKCSINMYPSREEKVLSTYLDSQEKRFCSNGEIKSSPKIEYQGNIKFTAFEEYDKSKYNENINPSNKKEDKNELETCLEKKLSKGNGKGNYQLHNISNLCGKRILRFLHCGDGIVSKQNIPEVKTYWIFTNNI